MERYYLTANNTNVFSIISNINLRNFERSAEWVHGGNQSGIAFNGARIYVTNSGIIVNNITSTYTSKKGDTITALVYYNQSNPTQCNIKIYVNGVLARNSNVSMSSNMDDIYFYVESGLPIGKLFTNMKLYNFFITPNTNAIGHSYSWFTDSGSLTSNGAVINPPHSGSMFVSKEFIILANSLQTFIKFSNNIKLNNEYIQGLTLPVLPVISNGFILQAKLAVKIFISSILNGITNIPNIRVWDNELANSGLKVLEAWHDASGSYTIETPVDDCEIVAICPPNNSLSGFQQIPSLNDIPMSQVDIYCYRLKVPRGVYTLNVLGSNLSSINSSVLVMVLQGTNKYYSIQNTTISYFSSPDRRVFTPTFSNGNKSLVLRIGLGNALLTGGSGTISEAFLRFNSGLNLLKRRGGQYTITQAVVGAGYKEVSTTGVYTINSTLGVSTTGMDSDFNFTFTGSGSWVTNSSSVNTYIVMGDSSVKNTATSLTGNFIHGIMVDKQRLNPINAIMQLLNIKNVGSLIRTLPITTISSLPLVNIKFIEKWKSKNKLSTIWINKNK